MTDPLTIHLAPGETLTVVADLADEANPSDEATLPLDDAPGDAGALGPAPAPEASAPEPATSPAPAAAPIDNRPEEERAAEAQAAAATAQATAAQGAHAAGVDGTYTVQPGDTLESIAGAIYGFDALGQALFEANSGVIGSDPTSLAAGTVLTVPVLMIDPDAQAAGAPTGGTDATT